MHAGDLVDRVQIAERARRALRPHVVGDATEHVVGHDLAAEVLGAVARRVAANLEARGVANVHPAFAEFDENSPDVEADHPNGTQVVPSGTAVLFAVLR